MKTFQIDDLTAIRQEGLSQLSAVVQWGAHADREIFFRTTQVRGANCCDPFVPAVLLPAMHGRFDVEIRAPVSEDVLRAARRVQEIFAAWHPEWRLAKVDARPATGDIEHPASAKQVATFFSGGVDSFYTLQKHRDEITHLIFVTGFDVPLHRSAMRQLVTRELRRTADEIGLPLIEVETNLRAFSDSFSCSWERHHGAAIAAVAHFLAPTFSKIYIPSTYALPCVVPYGSHPGVDPLWGSRFLELVHDGAEATRFEKIGALSSWDVAVQNLRVCWELVEGEYNCCRCKKCLWTMAFLRAHGVLERARTFSLPLDVQRLDKQVLEKPEERYRFIQALAKVELRGDDPVLGDAIRRLLSRRHSSWHALQRSMRRLRASAHARLRRTARACLRFAKGHRSLPRYEA